MICAAMIAKNRNLLLSATLPLLACLLEQQPESQKVVSPLAPPAPETA